MPRSLIALLLCLASAARAEPPAPCPGDACVQALADAALACASGEAGGCTLLADAHLEGSGVAASPLRASILRVHACGAGHADSCAAVGLSGARTLADALSSAPPMDVPDPAGMALLLAGCDRGALDACLAVARQVDHDIAGGLAPVILESLRIAPGSNTAQALLRDQRWLDEPLPTHLWRAAEPLGSRCEAGDADACALGLAILALERASARAVALQIPLAMTSPISTARASGPSPWVEVDTLVGAGASISRAVPLFSMGLGVRGGIGAFSATADLAFLPEVNRAPADISYRRSVLALGAGAAIKLSRIATLHLGAAFALGDWTSTPEGSRFSLGAQEAVELSWVLRPGHIRSPTLGLRVQVHQLVDLAGEWDHVGTVRLVLGLRFVSDRP